MNGVSRNLFRNYSSIDRANRHQFCLFNVVHFDESVFFFIFKGGIGFRLFILLSRRKIDEIESSDAGTEHIQGRSMHSWLPIG